MMTFAPLIAIAVGIVTPLVRRVAGRATGWLLALVPVAIALPVVARLPLGLDEAHRTRVTWIESLGVDLATYLDGLSATFVLLICGIGAVIVIYAEGYMNGGPRAGRVQGALMVFLGAMLGIVLSDDLISLFVYWELTSVCSFYLVGVKHESEDGRTGALRALFVTGGGGLALLAGLILMRLAAVDLGVAPEDAGLLSSLAAVDLTTHPWYSAILVLVLAGAFTKSAQIPFHFWLPSAMAAPTPVSAFLHSATMVKAGVYLLARLNPHLGDSFAWHVTVTSFGAATMLVAAGMAVVQKDLKRLLAFSTVSVLGMLTMLVGAGTELAVKAMVVLLVAHALYKAALFMVAGNVDHETGTRDVTRLGGLRRVMPWTAAAGVVAALSKAGAPPMFGFIGKELLYKAKLDLETIATWLIIAAVVSNILLVAVSLIVAVKPFFGRRGDPPRKPHEAPLAMILGPVLLAAAGVFVGLVPDVFDRTLGSAMATAIGGTPIEMKLVLWHGFSPSALFVVALSAVTLGLGFLVFRRVGPRLVPIQKRIAALEAYGAGAMFHKLADLALAGAARFTRVLQSGYLRRYTGITVLVALTLPVPWILRALADGSANLTGALPVHEVLVALLVLGGAGVASFQRSRLSAVAGLGVTGIGIAVLFALYSAPDLATTQIMVEALSVILLVLLFRRLPGADDADDTFLRSGRALLAVAAGLVVGLVAYVATTVRMDPEAARFFSDASVPEAFGRNVVNVVLVDFRALDTLGEIFVVAAAGVGVVALFSAVRRRAKEGGS
jgi:multicomponent Na+:H+ antiporter subunit A